MLTYYAIRGVYYVYGVRYKHIVVINPLRVYLLCPGCIMLLNKCYSNLLILYVNIYKFICVFNIHCNCEGQYRNQRLCM